MNRSKKNFAVCLLVSILLIGFDQLTKYLAVTKLKDGPVILWKGVFELRYLENNGAAFGMMQNMHILFYIATLAITVLLLYALWKMPTGKRYIMMRVVSVGILSGAIGNFIDRTVHHYVIDFLYFRLIDFPIFNVADIYVTCSAIGMVLSILFVYKEKDFAFISKNKETEGGK